MKQGTNAGDQRADGAPLAEEHLGLVQHVLGQLAVRLPRHADLDDLWGAGTMGLVEAARRFDPEAGTPFAAYAVRRIRGAIIDATRSIDWATRRLRRVAREVQRAEDSLEQAKGRSVTDDELATALDMGRNELDAVRRDAVAASVLHLDQPVGGDEDGVMTLGDSVEDHDASLSPSAALERQELVGTVRSALAHLPDAQRQVLERHFFGDELFRDIAADLGVTEARVSQLRAEALNALRAYLAAEFDGVPEVPDSAPGIRRRAAFVSQVTEATTWRSRLEAGAPDHLERAVS